MTIRTQVARSLLISAAAVAMATPAWAQTPAAEEAQAINEAEEQLVAPEQDEDLIIVTATKRASTVQDVPFSINAQTQEDIERANASTLEDISRNVAGLTVQNLGPGQSQVAIRGVSAGQIIRDQPGVKEQVGVYLDESVISLSLFTPDLDLFDLNRVETLRGPQGTLFGSGSVGGTLRYITNQPELGNVEGLVEGNINHVHDGDFGGHAKGAVNVPLGDTAAVRAVGYYTKYAGFIDSVGPAGGNDLNDGARYGGRVALLWEPTDNIRITPRVIYQKISVDGFNREEHYNLYYNEFTDPPHPDGPGKRTQYLKLDEKFTDKVWLTDLVGSVDFGAVELTSVSTYINRDILVSRDASALTGSVFVSFAGADPAIAEGARLTSNLRDTTKLKQWTQEARLSSTGDGPFQWLVGGFYSKVDRKYAQRLPTPGSDVFGQMFLDVIAPGVDISELRNGFPADSPYNADLPYDIRQAAAFGEGTYDWGTFKLTAGARYYKFKEERDFVSGGIFSNSDTRLGDKTKSNGISPRVILTWEPSNNLSVNAQVAKGFRLGGVNDPLNIPLCSPTDAATFGGFPTYDDETLWNYEAGFKYQKRGVTFNSAVFYTSIRDLQITADAGSCSSRVVFNVPKAHTLGIEAEVSGSPMDGLDLSFAGSYVNATFDSDVRTSEGAIIAGIEDGNRLPSVPNLQFAATAAYGQRFRDSGDWFVQTSWQYVGDRWSQPGDQAPGASVFNFIFFDPSNGDFGTNVRDFGTLKLHAYSLVNLTGGINFDSGLGVSLYVHNLLDSDPQLSIDRERGGRARLGYNIGTPRTIGITVRQSFGN